MERLRKEEKKKIADEKRLNQVKFVIVDKKKYDEYQKLRKIQQYTYNI